MSPPPYQPQILSKQKSLFSTSYSLTRSATGVIIRTLSSVGINIEIPKIVNGSEMSCSICLEAMDEEQGDLLTVSACSHIFHRTCIAKWKQVSRKCPCCRGPLSDEIGPTSNAILRILQNLPEDEVLRDITKCDIYANVIFCALGIAYSLSLIPLFMVGSVIIFVFIICYVCFQVPCFIIVTLPVGLIGMGLACVLQILYLIFRTLKFYMKILMCKLRWIDAYSFIIQRTSEVSEHIYGALF